ACATIAVAACCSTWARDRFAVSEAKSASWMRLREADRFSLLVCRLLIVDENRFWIAPRSARPLFTCDRAESITDRALVAPAALARSPAASDENELFTAVNTSAFEPPTDRAPLVLDSVTVPVFTAATVPPSVSVEPPNEIVSFEPPDTAKAPMPMLRPSVV